MAQSRQTSAGQPRADAASLGAELDGMACAVDSFLEAAARTASVVSTKMKKKKGEKFGLVFSDDLVITGANKGSPAAECKLTEYVGYQITHLNEVPVEHKSQVPAAVGSSNEVRLSLYKAPQRHVDPAASEDDLAKALLAEVVTLKRDHNSQTECLLHWVDRYKSAEDTLAEEAALLTAELERELLEIDMLKKLKKYTEGSTVATVSNFVVFSSGSSGDG